MAADPLTIDTQCGRLVDARWVASPNCDDRPLGCEIDLVIIHGISLPPGEFGGPWIEALFTNTLNPNIHPYFAEVHTLRVSAHLLIRRDGELVQFVPFHRRAWHAGASRYLQRANCNDYAIGIELEGTDDTPYAEVQYRQLERAVRALSVSYPRITAERVVGHCDVAPGRKSDPGPAFDWPRLYAALDQGPSVG